MKFPCNHVQACKLIAYLKGYLKVERFVVAVVIMPRSLLLDLTG